MSPGGGGRIIWAVEELADSAAPHTGTDRTLCIGWSTGRSKLVVKGKLFDNLQIRVLAVQLYDP